MWARRQSRAVHLDLTFTAWITRPAEEEDEEEEGGENEKSR